MRLSRMHQILWVFLISSENSLNQHIKLKHQNFWNKHQLNYKLNLENIYLEDKKEDKKQEDIFQFPDEDDKKDENQAIDFDHIVDNF